METSAMSLEESSASLASENTSESNPGRTSSLPHSAGDSDTFGDGECGEPLLQQHLVLDFTPTDEDTDFIQRKCCAFWEFVNKQPELEDWVAATDWDVTDEVSESDEYDSVSMREQPKPTPKPKSIEKTAVSMLELVEEKGLIDRAFESRLPTSHCSLGIINYEDEKPNDAAKGEHIDPPQLSISPSQRVKSQVIRKQLNNQPNATSSPTVRAMCHQLQEWDKEHPKCRPICKSRRREWRGELQNTSAELLLERKPVHDCFRRWPTRVHPNGPCPLFARTRHVTVLSRDVARAPAVRVCQAPVDDVVDTPYLKFAQMVQNLGAMNAVRSRCPFCRCGACCGCARRGYEPADETRDRARRRDMRDFDARVERDYQTMRTMYR